MSLMVGRSIVLALTLLTTAFTSAAAEELAVVRPKEIDEVLVNPGIGFTTFQRFNGDDVNEGLKWTEGFPIEYQPFTGSLRNKDHPLTTIAYFRVYWQFVEPERGVYRWDMFDPISKQPKVKLAVEGRDADGWYKLGGIRVADDPK